MYHSGLGDTPFRKLIARLERRYGTPELPPAKGPFELVLWENACYLLPDERRLGVFEALRTQVGLDARRILKADRKALLALARMGGMHPETRVERWLEIAQITATQFDGDLTSILKEPYARAKKALQKFPAIGAPGAEKILLFCGVASGLPLESNGLRVLKRIGYGSLQKSYAAMYRSVQDAVAPQIPRDARQVAQAHALLRLHGKQTCKDRQPLCGECAVSDLCRYAGQQACRNTGRNACATIE